MNEAPKIAIIGLGYVGLPLAIHLSNHFQVLGFDTNKQRINELKNNFDKTGEYNATALKNAQYSLSTSPESIATCDTYIITVPTPVDSSNFPDLIAIKNASKLVGQFLSIGNIVIYESTVYPGVTEDICGPILERMSKLECGKDFFLGYSPERINPGDQEHSIEKITKVVAGQTNKTTNHLSYIYSKVTKGGIFKAKNIKTAEAAKVIENAQRDINIAFINEICTIFNKMGIQTHDVLEAANTKWNFLDFKPGLVGGHCIGVDPFYLAEAARSINHNPEIILAGRRINDGIALFVAEAIHNALNKKRSAKILVLGLTFKENVSDLRNSKVIDLIKALKTKKHKIDVYDPIANKDDATSIFNIRLLNRIVSKKTYDCVIGAVAHKQFLSLTAKDLQLILKPGGLLADLKGIWRKVKLSSSYTRWEL